MNPWIDAKKSGELENFVEHKDKPISGFCGPVCVCVCVWFFPGEISPF
jgi:hypothetical protein